MTHYRAYLIGRAISNCADDDAAKKRAEPMVSDHDVELWQHARRSAKFDGKQKSPDDREDRGLC